MSRQVSIVLLLSILSANSFSDWDRQISSRLEGSNKNILFDISMETFSLVTPVIEWGSIYQSWVEDRSSMNYEIATLGLLTTYSLVGITKYVIRRKRPARNYIPRLWNTRLTPSFPSGHTASSAMWAATFFPNKQLLSLSYVAMSAWSQVYVGNHYLSDVLSGAIVGSLIGKIMRSKYSKDLDDTLTSFNIQIRF